MELTKLSCDCWTKTSPNYKMYVIDNINQLQFRSQWFLVWAGNNKIIVDKQEYKMDVLEPYQDKFKLIFIRKYPICYNNINLEEEKIRHGIC